MKENNNHNMMYLSIVAIVAIVAVVMLVGNNQATMTKTQTENQENLAGQAINVKTGEVLNDDSAIYFYNGANIQSTTEGLDFNVKNHGADIWNKIAFSRDGNIKANSIELDGSGIMENLDVYGLSAEVIDVKSLQTEEIFIKGKNTLTIDEYIDRKAEAKMLFLLENAENHIVENEDISCSEFCQKEDKICVFAGMNTENIDSEGRIRSNYIPINCKEKVNNLKYCTCG
jgi:hypothetical protein